MPIYDRIPVYEGTNIPAPGKVGVTRAYVGQDGVAQPVKHMFVGNDAGEPVQVFGAKYELPKPSWYLSKNNTFRTGFYSNTNSGPTGQFMYSYIPLLTSTEFAGAKGPITIPQGAYDIYTAVSGFTVMATPVGDSYDEHKLILVGASPTNGILAWPNGIMSARTRSSVGTTGQKEDSYTIVAGWQAISDKQVVSLTAVDYASLTDSAYKATDLYLSAGPLYFKSTYGFAPDRVNTDNPAMTLNVRKSYYGPSHVIRDAINCAAVYGTPTTSSTPTTWVWDNLDTIGPITVQKFSHTSNLLNQPDDAGLIIAGMRAIEKYLPGNAAYAIKLRCSISSSTRVLYLDVHSTLTATRTTYTAQISQLDPALVSDLNPSIEINRNWFYIWFSSASTLSDDGYVVVYWSSAADANAENIELKLRIYRVHLVTFIRNFMSGLDLSSTVIEKISFDIPQSKGTMAAGTYTSRRLAGILVNKDGINTLCGFAAMPISAPEMQVPVINLGTGKWPKTPL